MWLETGWMKARKNEYPPANSTGSLDRYILEWPKSCFASSFCWSLSCDDENNVYLAPLGVRAFGIFPSTTISKI